MKRNEPKKRKEKKEERVVGIGGGREEGFIKQRLPKKRIHKAYCGLLVGRKSLDLIEYEKKQKRKKRKNDFSDEKVKRENNNRKRGVPRLAQEDEKRGGEGG